MNTAELLVALQNTLVVCLLCIGAAVPLGCGLALLLQRTDLIGRKWLWIALGSQLAVPLYVFAGAWSAGFGYQGWMRWGDGWLGGLRLPGSNLSRGLGFDLGNLLAVSAIHALAAIPWVCLILSLGLIWANRGQEEMAVIEGGACHLLRFSLLTRLRSWLAAACLWCVVPVLTEMVVTNLYQVPTVAEQVYLDASRGGLTPWTYVAAVLLCMLPIVASGQWIRRHTLDWREVASGIAHYRGRVIPLGRARVVLSLCAWVFVLLIVALPLVNLIIKAGWQPSVDLAGQTRYGWSLPRLLSTVYESLTLYGNELSWSLLLSAASTGVALATAGGLSLTVQRQPWRGAIHLLALVMIAVPGPLVGMLIIALLNRSWPAWLGLLYDTTLAAPTLAQQFRLFPLAWLLCQTILGGISPRVWQLVELDGLNPLQAFARVVWPQTRKLWLAATMILAVVSIGELSCSILVLPPGVTTLSMRLFEMLHFGMRHQDSGLCGLLVVLGWLVSLAAWKTLTER